MDIEYANAYSEVVEILKHISEEDYNKIPKDKLEFYKTNANKNYVFTYNPSKTLSEQNVSKIAKGTIALLFRDYWATEAQREKIIAKQNYDRQKLEEEKREKYNVNVFNKEQEEKTLEDTGEKVLAVIPYKESVFKKFINFIKRIFR